MGTTPNFFIAGAAKSGTTSVACYLEQHPEVFLPPIKQPSYFAREIIPSLQLPNWQKKCVLDWSSYLKLFRNVTDQKAIGEASTAYLIAPEAPADIRAAFPRARIIIMLRSHVERAFSTYLMLCRNGRLRSSFSDVIRRPRSGTAPDWRFLILETRKIAAGVERFLTVFPREQVRWYFYEEFSSNPIAVMRSIHEFLGIDPDFKPDLACRRNAALLPKAPLLHRIGHMTGVANLANKITPDRVRPYLRRLLYQTGPEPRLSVEDRALLVEYFREDIEKLSKLVEKDLGEWLKVE
jgi:hypothetical protein